MDRIHYVSSSPSFYWLLFYILLIVHLNICCFHGRMGFSAEQLARWVAERTDVNVCVVSINLS